MVSRFDIFLTHTNFIETITEVMIKFMTTLKSFYPVMVANKINLTFSTYVCFAMVLIPIPDRVSQYQCLE